MTAKKITISTKPVKTNEASATAWIEKRVTDESSERMKRLTIDIPESLHRNIKAQCAIRNNNMADEIRDLLTQKYGNQ